MQYIKKQNLLHLWGGLIIITLALGVGTGWMTSQIQAMYAPETLFTEEMYQLYFDTQPSFSELADFFEELARAEGAARAFDILINAKLPPAIDTHLLGHVVGDVLYEQEGADGLAYCTSDLGYACSHSIVIRSLLERGQEVFSIINDVCEEAPGPSGYTMCFHGFGHGVLAYVNYELPKAIELCRRVGTKTYGNYETVECVGGVVMEMRGGIHNPIVWMENGKPYLDDENPLAMCQADYMPSELKEICYIYITPFIFDSINSEDLPEFADYAPAFRKCEAVTDDINRYACYAGFAKEFVSFEYGRDVRQIANSSDDSLQHMWEACAQAQNAFGISACVEYSVYSLYRQGLYPAELPARYCALVDNEYKSVCYETAIRSVLISDVNSRTKKSFCRSLPEGWKENCNAANIN